MSKSRTNSTTERRVTLAGSQKPSSAHLNPILETPVSQAGTPSRHSRLNPIRISAKSAVDEQIVEIGPSTRSSEYSLAFHTLVL